MLIYDACRAVGNKMYGTKYHENIVETLRKSAELCDCLQSFFILHSMGGGGCGTWSRDSHVTWLTHRDWVRSWYKNPRGFERRIPWSLQVCFLRKIENWKWKHCFRFVVAVFPSADDDVITSPYNRLMKRAFTEEKNVQMFIVFDKCFSSTWVDRKGRLCTTNW